MSIIRAGLCSLVLLLAGCGGGGGGSSSGGSSNNTPPPTYTVGGTVSGLATNGSLTVDTLSDSLTISTNGAFTFTDELESGESYDVTITTQPDGQKCSVADGSGTIADADATNIAITCEDILVSISWDPSGHSSVNQTGGGYRVYYSQTSGFVPGDPGVIKVEVPFDGVPVTSLKIVEPDNGTWYFQVQAYSDLGESVLSPETAITIGG